MHHITKINLKNISMEKIFKVISRIKNKKNLIQILVNSGMLMKMVLVKVKIN